MRKINICENHTAYWFDNIKEFQTGIFVIEKPDTYYIIDTYCGSEAIAGVLNTLDGRKMNIVVNTHYHWDHIWGNAEASKYGVIMAHKYCDDLINLNFKKEFEENKQYKMGEVSIKNPDITFKDRYYFDKDEVEFRYTPGHTMDSISIYDKEQKVLYVGDNVEKPIVSVEQPDIELYIQTLESYLEMEVSYIVGSHTCILTKEDIKQTIQYLNRLQKGEQVEYESEYMRKVHKRNQLMIQ
ncbi:putative cyclase/dehydrase [Lachnospiraceae bacterium KM106-2]|nr:putative cyclase/dehydrase [Lachnospiraceae bacterium KM106-2]